MVLQLFIIFFMLFLGEVFVYVTGVRIPASIVGMLLLTLSLKLGIIKLNQVKGVSDFLTSNLAFFFIPPGVSLMLYFSVIKEQILPISVSIIVSTIVVFAVTAWTYRIVRERTRNSKNK